MEGKMVHLRIPRMLYSSCVQIVKENGFSNIQEFIKESIRARVIEYKREEAIAKLEGMKGKMKGVKRLSKKQLDKAAEKYVKEDPLKILGKYGLR